ncbi:hypothetical protein K7640_07370 [Micromonospora sp. PLK6-60]|uniref:hypothetical protein n=1 Tax=Micromonospora sp. PLK6-60 TaxID=2873383 RepID=UPI001CA67C0A|nr:hypothetical protein [Micromonospora sp. PLK6-60]MBY8871661.1 hypothetical protein [Micromonospora sp. PLK6-60]
MAVGSPALIDEFTPAADPAAAHATAVAAELQLAGHTAVVVFADGQPIGVLALADRIRAEAARTQLPGGPRHVVQYRSVQKCYGGSVPIGAEKGRETKCPSSTSGTSTSAMSM